MKIHKELAYVLILLGIIVLFSFSCGGGGGDSGSGSGTLTGSGSGSGSGAGSGSTSGTTFDAGTVKAQQVITSTGGVVEVKDSTSPTYGARVTFYNNSLEAPETIQILHHSQYPALPSGVTANGPVIGLNRSQTGLFNGAIMVQLPVTQKDVKQTDEFMQVLTYDEQYKEWVRAQSWYAYNQGKMILLPGHFSKFVPVIRKYKGTGEIWTTFNMDIDTMVFQNTPNNPFCPEYGGVCAGMSVFTKWFFENQGHGLKCYYNKQTDQQVSCKTHAYSEKTWKALLYTKIDMFLTAQLDIDHRDTVTDLWNSSKRMCQSLYRCSHMANQIILCLFLLGSPPPMMADIFWLMMSTKIRPL